jgi:uncharacterized protein YcbX
MHLSGLFLYPVKSLRGISVPSATLDAHGLVGDRRFLVVDDAGRFLTQRTLPRMALIATALDATHLTLSVSPSLRLSFSPSSSPASAIRIPRASDPTAPLRTVSVWKSENLLAEDCGDEAADFLSSFLAKPCRLVRQGPAFHRPILQPTALPGDVVSFADGYPLLVIGEASLADLNDRLIARGSEPLPMDRFRPNLVIADAPAFAEDTWPRLKINDAILRAGGPCARCILTTTDQATGARDGPEPLRTLATYRRDATHSTDVNFGQNLIPETNSATLRVGDTVTFP